MARDVLEGNYCVLLQNLFNLLEIGDLREV